MPKARIPKIVIVGVGHAAHDIARFVDPWVRNSVWTATAIANRYADGQPTDGFVHVDPPPLAGDAWKTFGREGVPVLGIRRLMKTADVVLVVGGPDPLTRLVLQVPRRRQGVSVLFCLTRHPQKRSKVRIQREAVAAYSNRANTVIHVPVIPAAGDLYEQDPPMTIEADASRMIARAVSGICAPLLSTSPEEHVSLREARRCFARGGFGGMAVTSGSTSRALEAAFARAFDDRVSGGFRIPRARKVWLCLEGGGTLRKETVTQCLDGLSASGAHPRLASTLVGRTVRHPDRRRKVSLSFLAFGFRKLAKTPLPLPSTLEAAEEKAVKVLEQLLPEQANRYREERFVEVRSKLHPNQLYRIHGHDGPFATEIVRDGEWAGELCLQFRNKHLPPTDRVIAEYLLIRDDEQAYLQAANLSPPLDQVGDRELVPEGWADQTIELVQRMISDQHGVDVGDLTSGRRGRSLTLWRQIAIYLGRKVTGMSLPQIGRRFGNRNHSCVFRALELIERRCRRDEAFAARLGDLERLIDARIREGATWLGRLDPRQTFSTYVVGSANAEAFAVAQRVAEDPQRNLNPLFIHGAHGVGKTHLLNAIGNRVLEKKPTAQVAYICGEVFLEACVAAAQSMYFDRLLRNLDLLIIDDVHRLRGREGSQAGLFAFFNRLHSIRRQIVIASDCSPEALRDFDPWLTARFKWGAVEGIRPPEAETRSAMLMKKARAGGLDLSPDVVQRIASTLDGDARRLEAALTRFAALGSLGGMPPTVETADRVLADLVSLGMTSERAELSGKEKESCGSS